MFDLILSPHCHTQDGTLSVWKSVRPKGAIVSQLAEALRSEESVRLLLRNGYEGFVFINIKKAGTVDGRAIPAFATDDDRSRYLEAVA